MIVLLALPAIREALERVMIAHMLVQIPLLAAAGVLIASAIPTRWTERIASWNRSGISGILLALIASSWWMVPRALDSVLANSVSEVAKFVTIPLLVGAPLALSWPRLGGIGRAFVIANVLPMWAVVGWLYVAAPVRVCNFYLVEQQVVAGRGLLWVSAGLGLLAGALAFRTHRQSAVAW
jgi:hypothetical protein